MKRLIIGNLISKWHLYGFEAYLKNINKLDDYHIIIFIQYHQASKSYRIHEEDFNFLDLNNTSIKVEYVNKLEKQTTFLKNILRSYDVNRDSIIMISAHQMNIYQLFAIKRYRNVQYVLIDEGMGSYYSKSLWKLETQTLGKSRTTPFDFIKNNLKRIIQHKYCNNLIDNCLLIKNDNSWVINKKSVNNYISYFNSCIKKIKINCLNNSDVIFVSDNISLMLKNKEDEIYIYQCLYQWIIKKFNTRRIWFKPHPNEKSDLNKISELKSIGFSILNDNYSFENITHSYNLIVLGLGSTSLLTTSLIFKKISYSLFNLIDNDFLNEYGISKKKEFFCITKDIKNLIIEDKREGGGNENKN